MTAEFPEPGSSPVSCNSWVIRHQDGLLETADRALALAVFNKGLSVKTAYQHLVDLNATLSENNEQLQDGPKPA